MASIDLAMQFSSADPLGHFDDLRRMIQKQPQRSDLRIFLFQIYCVQGEWMKASTQLDVLLELDPSSKPMVETYREALRCEALRREVFDGKRSPLVLGAPQDWLAMMIEALRVDAEGRPDAAAELRAKALEAAPATSGKLDDAPFAWLADADSRLGPREVIVGEGDERVDVGRQLAVTRAGRRHRPERGAGAGRRVRDRGRAALRATARCPPAAVRWPPGGSPCAARRHSP